MIFQSEFQRFQCHQTPKYNQLTPLPCWHQLFRAAYNTVKNLKDQIGRKKRSLLIRTSHLTDSRPRASSRCLDLLTVRKALNLRLYSQFKISKDSIVRSEYKSTQSQTTLCLKKDKLIEVKNLIPL